MFNSKGQIINELSNWEIRTKIEPVNKTKYDYDSDTLEFIKHYIYENKNWTLIREEKVIKCL